LTFISPFAKLGLMKKGLIFVLSILLALVLFIAFLFKVEFKSLIQGGLKNCPLESKLICLRAEKFQLADGVWALGYKFNKPAKIKAIREGICSGGAIKFFSQFGGESAKSVSIRTMDGKSVKYYFQGELRCPGSKIVKVRRGEIVGMSNGQGIRGFSGFSLVLTAEENDRPVSIEEI